jgi:hypothetical protein
MVSASKSTFSGRAVIRIYIWRTKKPTENQNCLSFAATRMRPLNASAKYFLVQKLRLSNKDAIASF